MPLAISQNFAIERCSILYVTTIDHKAAPNTPMGTVLTDSQ